ncbi:MAG: 3-oxoadipate enol-lactonase [Acidobacteria bacterium]|nr:3-oxoadipate enol-lactonase [Acidobacteriota bacterium]
MPFALADGTRHYYRMDGGDGRPVLMLSHSLGLDHGMWDAQGADVLPHMRVLRYDTRGHGASDVTEGDYTIEALGRDALAVADAAGVQRFAFCGLSLGGMVGQWLAVNAPERLTHLILANTSPRLTDPAAMEARRLAVLEGGMPAIADMAMGRFFSPEVLRSNTPVVGSTRRTLLGTSAVGYAGCCAAVRDMNGDAALPRVNVPTLVIGGDRDASMPWEAHGDVLAQSITGARAVRLNAAHLSNLERPRAFSTALLEFLLPPADGTGERGMAVRRAVLGDAYVDRSVAAKTDFTADFQALITAFAWGTIWARPGLDRRTRRLLVLTATAALGRWEEFRLHVRSGLADDLEPCDIEEVLLQTAVYAGIPAANTAFGIASEELPKVPRLP